MSGRDETSGRIVPRARRGRVLLLCLLAIAIGHSDAVARSEHSPCVVGLRVESVIEIDSEPGPSRPEGVAIDHHGRVLVADTGNHRVLVLATSGEVVDEFGGYGWQEGRLDGPTDVAIYPGFFVYVLDGGNRRVLRFDVEGDFVDLVLGEDEIGTPVGIEVGKAGGLLIVDDDRQAILTYSQFEEETEAIGRFGVDHGGLVRPADVAVGPSREVAVADPGRGVVAVFDEFGSPLRTFASGDSLKPDDVLFDETGCLFVADAENGRVLAFSPDARGPTATLGRRSAGEGFSPSGLALAPDGSLVVLDREGGRVLAVAIERGGCTRPE